jgi:hypothetical protein
VSEDYIIEPIAADEERMADGVCVNECGAWLGEFMTNIADDGTTDDKVMPFSDEDGDYISAPPDWRQRIVERVR